MDRTLCGGVIVLGFFGLVMLAGQAGAQTGSSAAGGERNYGGSSGSQILQEQMYEDRMKEILGEPTAGQGMEGQKSMKGAEESSQKMQGQSGMKGASSGDRTMGEGKAKGSK